jgi:GNAT superfamily N-acetyltransferase
MMDNKTCDQSREVVIREMKASDAADVAKLSTELGYPMTAEEVEDRLKEFAPMDNHAVFSASLEGRVVGWIDVGIVHHLQSPPCGEIGGLIVSGDYQGRGIGRMLVSAAEAWVAAKKVTRMLVRSRITREGAHEFYLRLNFSRVKTSAVFTKCLEAPDS